MGNRYSKFIQIYKTTNNHLVPLNSIILLTDLSVDEVPSFCKLSQILKQKFLKTHIGMFQIGPTKVRTKTTNLKKSSLENTFLPPSPESNYFL